MLKLPNQWVKTTENFAHNQSYNLSKIFCVFRQLDGLEFGKMISLLFKIFISIFFGTFKSYCVLDILLCCVFVSACVFNLHENMN